MTSFPDCQLTLGSLTQKIKFCVGETPNIKEFIVHAILITQLSKFFKAAIQARWKEAEDRAVKLLKNMASVFHLYLHYLYRDKVPARVVIS